MNDRYQTPLAERYASKEMQYIFSPDMKFKTWRRLWIALAETEKELGLDITDEQIAELKAHKDDINYEDAKKREKEVRHDVMSHVYAYGLQCPKAKGIIHLGATSCYVGDNTDIIIMTEGLKLVRKKLVNVINELSKFADKYKAQPTLAFTHFQPAQPTTVGKRATTVPPMTTNSWNTSFHSMQHPPFLASGGTSNKVIQPPNTRRGKHDHLCYRQHLSAFHCSIATDEKQPSLAESLYDRGSHVRMAPFYFASPSCAPVADMIK